MGAVRRRAGEAPTRLLWLLALPASFLAVAGFLLWESRGQTLYADEWFFSVHGAGSTLRDMLMPDQGNLVFGAVIVYKATLSLAGAHDHLALRLVWIALDLLCAGLFFAIASARVGRFAAIVPALLLSVFGASWELFGGTLGINVLLSVAAALGALLALERRSRGGDVLACILLTFAVLSHSTGLAFAALILASVLIPGERRRRAWIAIVPLALYAAWTLWARKFGQSGVTGETLASAPASLIESLESATSALFGAFRDPGPPADPSLPRVAIFVDREPGAILAVALVAVVLWRLRELRFPWRALPPVAALAAYWASLALVSPAREPAEGRYQYASAIFILLLLTELWRGSKPSLRAKAAIGALGVVAIVPNVINLNDAASFMRGVSEQDKAKLAVVDALADRIPPDMGVNAPPYDIGNDLIVSARDYSTLVDSFGSPADSAEDLPGAGVAARQAADRELIYLLDLKAVPLKGTPPPRGCRTRSSATLASFGGFPVGSGFIFRSPSEAAVSVGLRRFSDDFYPLAEVKGRGWQRLAVPSDELPSRWRAELASSAPVRVCPIARASRPT